MCITIPGLWASFGEMGLAMQPKQPQTIHLEPSKQLSWADQMAWLMSMVTAPLMDDFLMSSGKLLSPTPPPFYPHPTLSHLSQSLIHKFQHHFGKSARGVASETAAQSPIHPPAPMIRPPLPASIHPTTSRSYSHPVTKFFLDDWCKILFRSMQICMAPLAPPSKRFEPIQDLLS